MSLCDKANCFFGVLFLIQIGLSKSEGKPCPAAPRAARDTGSYLSHSVLVFTDDATLETLLLEYLHADRSVLLYISEWNNQFGCFIFSSPPVKSRLIDGVLMCHDVLWSVVKNMLPSVQTGLSSRVKTSSKS